MDLAPFCNRGFKDDVGDDGKGGWPDQGPKADLRQFPTGEQNFGGVPFSIGKEPHTCIVLKSDRRPLPDLYPDEATIPLGFRLEGLCFLHTTAWGGAEPTGLYQIQYADGTTAEIVLVEGENIFGWTRAPAEFSRERGTRSRVAWTGTTPLFPVICVSQMLWVNPRPDVPVKALRFSNPPRICCPALIAVTAAVKPGKADVEAAAASQAKREALKRGLAAADAGKDADARGRPGRGPGGRPQARRRPPAPLRTDRAHSRRKGDAGRLQGLGRRGCSNPPALQQGGRDPRTLRRRQRRPGGLHQVARNRMEPTASHRGKDETGEEAQPEIRNV